MGRWLAPRLPGPQHWVVHDRDEDLLKLAAADVPGPAADGAAVTVEARQSDITRLAPEDLAGASVIVASALLDILTARELLRMLYACAGRPDAARTDRPRSGDPAPAGIPWTRASPPPSTPTSDARRRPVACSARPPSRPPSKSSAARAPTSSSGRAPGDSMRPTPTWRPSGSTGGSLPPASRTPRWPPRPTPTATGASRRRPPGSSPSPSPMPTCWCCRDDRATMDAAGRRGRNARRPGLASWGPARSSTGCVRSTRGALAAASGLAALDHDVLRLALEDRRARPRRPPASGNGGGRVLPLALPQRDAARRRGGRRPPRVEPRP